MLEELQPSLPPDAAVYVLFDSWYASAALLRFIRRQGWYTLCAIKSNRRLDGTRLRDHDQRFRDTRQAHVAWQRRTRPPPTTPGRSSGDSSGWAAGPV